MIQFIQNNLGSILVGLLLLIIVGLAIYKLYRDEKSGKGSCSGCSGSCSACHIPELESQEK